LAPAFVLSRAGYDVWLGNSRGNKYSRGKVASDNINRKKYWEFDFEKMGDFDLPTFINYILQVTGKSKLAYIGHS
jgi:lysosomal acid lipase/cholesteryl ester hydrolase